MQVISGAILVSRILGDDRTAEEELVERYRSGVFVIIRQVIGNRPATGRCCIVSILQRNKRNPSAQSWVGPASILTGCSTEPGSGFVRSIRKKGSRWDNTPLRATFR